jgi:major membrane immunogen (membrane-anchored lipoprotein)
MTQEQYYWFVRRPQMLRAANIAYGAVAGYGSTSQKEDTNLIKVESSEQLLESIKDIKDGQVLKMSNDIALEENSDSLIIDKNVTIDLNEKTISAKKLNNSDSIFSVKRGATLTLSGNGKVESNDDSVYSAIKLTVKGETPTGESANVIINDGTYHGKYYAITGNGQRGDTDLTINGGTFNSDALAIYHPQNGKLTINGGTFESNDCIIVKSGTVKITGGLFKSTGEKVEFKHNGNGWNETGDCFAVEACDYPGLIPNVEITGGTFISENGAPVASYYQDGYEDKRLTKFVKGGKFNKELDSDLIADGYEQKQDGDFYIVVKKSV